MTMTLDLPPDMLEKMNEAAKRIGLTPEEFVVKQMAAILDVSPPKAQKPEMSYEEWREKLFSIGFELPPGTVINEAAYSRDSMYDDRW